MTSGVRRRAGTWLTGADPATLLYGAIVSAAVLATVSAGSPSSTFVGVATVLVLVIYWMSHVYVHAASLPFDSDTGHLFARLRTASVHEFGVLKGGLPAIIVYVIAHVAGAATNVAASIAVYFTVVLLAGVGYLGAHQNGATGRVVVLEVAGATSFGLLIVAAKTLLH